VDEAKAIGDLASTLPFGGEIQSLLGEFDARETLESRLAHDCDQLELLLVLKEEKDRGNPQADEWIPLAVARLREEISRRLAAEILRTHSSDWWWGDRGEWWIWAGKAKPPEAP
jgi:putative hydrolase of HD superfamily